MMTNLFMKSPAWRSLLVLALLLSSCSRVQLTCPLSDPDKARPDERLCGAWKLSKDDSEDMNDANGLFLFIGKANERRVPASIMKAILVGLDSKDFVDCSAFYFFSTSAGENSYVDLFEENVFKRAKSLTWDKRKIQPFHLCKYATDGRKLTVWWEMDDAAVEAAVRVGKVKGTIEEKKEGPSKKKEQEEESSTKKKFLILPDGPIVTLTNGEDLLRFLKAGGDKVIFSDKKWVFLRMK